MWLTIHLSWIIPIEVEVGWNSWFLWGSGTNTWNSRDISENVWLNGMGQITYPEGRHWLRSRELDESQMWHIFIISDTGSWHIIKARLEIIYSFWILWKYSNHTRVFTSKNVKAVVKSYLSIFLHFYFLRNVEKPHLECWRLELDIFP